MADQTKGNDMEAATSSWRSLGDMFVQRGIITEADLESALAEEAAGDRRLAEILVERGLVTGKDITDALMKQMSGLHHLLPDPEPTFPAIVPENGGPNATEPVLTLVGQHDSEPPSAWGETDSAADPLATARTLDHPEDIVSQAEERRRAAEAEMEALGNVWLGLHQIQADLERHDLTNEAFDTELASTQHRVLAKKERLSEEIAFWRATREEVEHTAARLEEIRAELEIKLHELPETETKAVTWTTRLASLEAEIKALSEEANQAAARLQFLAAQEPTDGPPQNAHEITEIHHADAALPALGANGEAAAATTGYLYFVPKDDGHDIVEMDGVAPQLDEVVNLSGGLWVVTKIASSPLPDDNRKCIFLTAVER
jgi:hypothetical protein